MKEDKENYILDTSALLTYIEDEEGSEYVEDLLIRGEKGDVAIYLAFISLTEVFYITAKERDVSEAFKRVTNQSIIVWILNTKSLLSSLYKREEFPLFCLFR